MLKWLQQLLICSLFLSISSILYADSQTSSLNVPEETALTQNPVKAELIAEEETIQPGRPFWVAVRLKHQEHWHSYWKNPGDSGMPTTIEWNLPEGFTASPIVWPTPKKFIVNDAIGYGYEDEATLLVQLTPPQTLPHAQEKMELGANFRWVVCSDSNCILGEFSTMTPLSVASTAPKAKEEFKQLFHEARHRIPKQHEDIQVQRKGGHIELRFQLPLDSIDHLQAKISFYPENNEVIDHSVDPILHATAENPNHYAVFLKSAPGSEEKSLKGIVVVEDPRSSVSHSMEINAPIASVDNELISIGEPQKKSLNPMPISSSASAEFEGGLGLALLLAFVGGMILNLMPCVLPVISFKILSFVNLAGQCRARTFKHGVAFSGGVLISFWVLAGALLILQTYGHAVGWGFQLQEPLFVGILSAILLLFSLSQFGIFEMGTSMTSWAGQAQSARKGGFVGSFFSGVLATAVATPCTGPFLGTAVGFAVTLPTILAMLVFTSLGLGMALPYLILAGFPRLLRFLPKPGAWMVTFKEAMGFIMLATVLWLVWVFGAQTDSFAVFLLLVGFFCLAMGGWIYGKWGSSLSKKKSRVFGRLLTIICFTASGYSIISAALPEDTAHYAKNQKIADAWHGEVWEEFSPERVAELHSKGIPVLIDFTAKWCLICQANHLVLSNNEVNEKFAKLGVVKMKADWTKKDMIITQELSKHGRNSVPLYLLYGSNSTEPPQILPQVLTPSTVIEYLEKIEG